MSIVHKFIFYQKETPQVHMFVWIFFPYTKVRHILSLCFSAISGTSSLPWAARRKRLNTGCIVGSISATRIPLDLVKKCFARTPSSDCVGQQIAELKSETDNEVFPSQLALYQCPICTCHATISEKHDTVLLEH